MIDFKGNHYPNQVVLYAVFSYVRYAVSNCDLEKILQEHGVHEDDATLNLWVVRYSPQIAKEAQWRKAKISSSWQMDETYIKVKGKSNYLYRAVDRFGGS
jgi:putative transposase